MVGVGLARVVSWGVGFACGGVLRRERRDRGKPRRFMGVLQGNASLVLVIVRVRGLETVILKGLFDAGACFG